MRLLRAVLGVAFGLAVLAFGLAFALPRLVDAESVRATVTEAARDSLGRELRYETLEFGILPPSLRVIDVAISGETAASAPLLEARVVGLRVSLLPLLWGTVLIDSLQVEGATVRLTRAADGFELPRPPRPPASGEATDAAPVEDGGVSLAVRDVELVDATLVLTDRSVSPVTEWRLDDVELDTSGSLLGGRLEIDGTGTLASGGGLALDGAIESGPNLDLRLRFSELALAPFDPYLEDLSLAGRAEGVVTLEGPVDELETLGVDLEGSGLALRQGETRLTGGLRVEGEIASPFSAPSGLFEVDATAAELRVGSQLTKAAGIPGRVAGRVVAGSGGSLGVEDLRLVLHRLDAAGRIASVSPLVFEVDAEPFPVEGWDAVLPALAGGALSGKLALDGIVYDAAAKRLGGEIRLHQLTRSVSGAAPIVLEGTLRADQARLVGEGLTLSSGGESIPVALELSDLFRAPHYSVAIQTTEAEANRTLTAFLSKPDTLYGPLAVDGRLSGPLGGDVLDQAKGRLGFGIEEGRLVGVSLLKSVFDRFGAAGVAAIDLGRALGGRDLQRFYGDRFEVLSGNLDVSGGVARTEDLVFRYQGYDVRLRGSIGLADLSLQMAGDLTLREEIDQEIAKGLGLQGHTPRQRVIPLASVTGTLDAPKVALGSGAVARFVSAYAADSYAGELRERVEKELGEGGGAIVDQGLEVLQGILGAGRRKPAPPPETVPAPAPVPDAEPPATPPAGADAPAPGP